MTSGHNAITQVWTWLHHRDPRTGVAVAAAVLCLSAGHAHAQINPFRGYNGPVLTKADLDQGTQAADKLLRVDGAKVGTSENWAGPTSGNSGILTVEKTFDRHGMTCRALKSVVNYKAGTTRTWNLNVCRTANGAWKLA
jgi:hypothetical protein